jgi:patatin-like phospholipase/acyl hydrolase
MAKLMRILSIDGGGIRGVIPAMVLAEIESLARKPVSKLFDLIAGTSTGGILALGLTRPGAAGKPCFTAAEMTRLYEGEGGRIFHRSNLRRIITLGHLAEEKYTADGIEGVLDQYFGESRLKDALTDVIVTSYETERRFPFFFKSRYARTREDYDFSMKAVARATSAAPTYFEPLKLDADASQDYYSLIDGGVYANNPAMCGYVEAKATFPDYEDICVVSLGTGELTKPLHYEDVKRWGLVSWAQPILNIVLDGVSSTVDYQLRQLLPPAADGFKRYWRFQVRLSEETDAMDDARPENIRALKLLAESLIRDRADDLKLLSEQLTK